MEPTLSVVDDAPHLMDTRGRTDPLSLRVSTGLWARTRLKGRGRRPGAPYAAVMATIVLRIRLIAGDRLDVTYEDPDVDDADEVAEMVIAALADNSGMIRTRHGDRLVVLYGRGVAALEVAPRGAVL